MSLPEKEEDIIGYDWIRCSSFQTLVKENQVENIDLIHIDTEGYDYEILKLFPFDDYQPTVVIFEHSHLSQEDRKAATEMLESQGYNISSYGADTLALRT